MTPVQAVTIFGSAASDLPPPLLIQPSNLKLWLRADSLSATPVASWQDKRGGANPTFAQATGGLQPTWSATAMNGRPGVTFDGIDDVLRSTDSISGSASDYTIFLAIDSNDTPTVDSFMFDTDPPLGGERLVLAHNRATDLYFSGVAWVGTADVTETVPLVLSYSLTSGAGVVYKNGVLAEGGLAYTPTSISTLVALGGWSGGAGSNFKGVIAEVIVYDLALSANKRVLIENYLRSRYATG